MMMPININPAQKQIWLVRFDPSEGDEISKVRPAIVINAPDAGKMRLRILVPITGWQLHFATLFWMVKLHPSSKNGLDKLSSADCFQVKSLSINRSQSQIGEITDFEMNEVLVAINWCIRVKKLP